MSSVLIENAESYLDSKFYVHSCAQEFIMFLLLKLYNKMTILVCQE